MFTGIIREVGSLKSKIRHDGGAVNTSADGGRSGGNTGASGSRSAAETSADAGRGAGNTGASGSRSAAETSADAGISAGKTNAECGKSAGDTGMGGSVVTLVISCKKLKPKPGDSICVNGVCLTVTKKTATGFEVDVVAETLKRTNLGELSAIGTDTIDTDASDASAIGTGNRGAALNLEPALRAKDTVDGHFVTGHVDAVARVTKVDVTKVDVTKACATKSGAIKSDKTQNATERIATELTIKMPKNLMKFITYKGSITINGVSLTVGAIKSTLVNISLIPFTAKNTNLGALRKGDTVNIEIDLIARYLYNFGDGVRRMRKVNA